jgi:hypothetical protein
MARRNRRALCRSGILKPIALALLHINQHNLITRVIQAERLPVSSEGSD